jgi:hypothetical protein
MKIRLIPGLIFLFAAASASTQADVVLSVNPVADSFLSASHASSNYGGAGALEISALGSTNGQFQSLLRFDLASVKSGFDSALGAGNWVLTGVSLQLSEESPANLPAFFNPSMAGLIGVTWMNITTWTEGTGRPLAPGSTGVNFNDLPSLTSLSDQSLGSFSFDGGTAGGAQTYSLTASSGLTSNVLAGNLISLRLSAADNSVSALFTSNNNAGPPEDHPLLTFTAVAVPEPSAGALLATGCAGLLVLRRRIGGLVR